MSGVFVISSNLLIFDYNLFVCLFFSRSSYTPRLLLYPFGTVPQSSREAVSQPVVSGVQLLSHVWLCDPMDCTREASLSLQQTPRVCSDSCPLSRWCHPTISSCVVPFSFHLQSFPASESFLMSPFFELGGENIGASASASVLPMNIQDWFPSGLTGWISWQSKGPSRVISNTTIRKHQFFSAQPSL